MGPQYGFDLMSARNLGVKGPVRDGWGTFMQAEIQACVAGVYEIDSIFNLGHTQEFLISSHTSRLHRTNASKSVSGSRSSICESRQFCYEIRTSSTVCDLGHRQD
jgi:hypothetical protein